MTDGLCGAYHKGIGTVKKDLTADRLGALVLMDKCALICFFTAI